MSKNETPMLLRLWERERGTLLEEFPAVRRSATASERRLDGVIVLGGEHRRARPEEVELGGRDLLVVQVKAMPLGMYLLGQALFSRHLMEPFAPRSIRTMALCTRDDSVLRPLAEQYGIEVVVGDAP